jgi:hypothetical protein
MIRQRRFGLCRRAFSFTESGKKAGLREGRGVILAKGKKL